MLVSGHDQSLMTFSIVPHSADRSQLLLTEDALLGDEATKDGKHTDLAAR
jgi:hypothetical protein